MLSLYDEAKAIVDQREKEYGDSRVIIPNIAERWSDIVGIDITPKQVILMMMELKRVRLKHSPDHRDSLVDLWGYAILLERV